MKNLIVILLSIGMLAIGCASTQTVEKVYDWPMMYLPEEIHDIIYDTIEEMYGGEIIGLVVDDAGDILIISNLKDKGCSAAILDMSSGGYVYELEDCEQAKEIMFFTCVEQEFCSSNPYEEMDKGRKDNEI